jgi:hypothetical protein
MPGSKDRNCQVRMSSSLWNRIGETARDLGHRDARGRHSVVIREMVAATVAMWTHSPYVCQSACHTVYVTRDGNVFIRQVQVIRLNSSREKLPHSVEMKPEKREYYHRKYISSQVSNEHAWFLSQWLFNYFAVWNGKKDADDLEAFEQQPLDSWIDTFGTTSKAADLAVNAVGGRFLTREITVGLRDYVLWKEPNTPIFDRIDIPIDIPTSDLEICVVVDQDLFAGVEEEEIANLALEFRNRESARFEGKEVALYPEIGIEEQYGRSLDEGADQMLLKVRRLRQRISAILSSKTSKATQGKSYAEEAAITSSLRLPMRFLFYWLRWPTPHLGIEACVRWEKPIYQQRRD